VAQGMCGVRDVEQNDIRKFGSVKMTGDGVSG
jgi:hypothetical protein